MPAASASPFSGQVIWAPLSPLGTSERFTEWPPKKLMWSQFTLCSSRSHSADSRAWLARMEIRSWSWSVSSPPAMMSLSNSSGESSMPSSFCIQLQGAAMPPPEICVLPPMLGSFSRMMTLLPAWAAVRAAERPAPPAPSTMTSASVVAGASYVGATCSALASASVSKPACLQASVTAFRTATLVMVAAVTESTFSVWFSTMRGSMTFSTDSTMPGISSLSPILMSAILPPLTVTSTLTSACLPRAAAL